MRHKNKKPFMIFEDDIFLDAFGKTILLVGGSILFGAIFGTLYRFLKGGIL